MHIINTIKHAFNINMINVGSMLTIYKGYALYKKHCIKELTTFKLVPMLKQLKWA